MNININHIQFEASFGRAGQLPVSDLPEVVFAGKSNVGKSSLINKFFNRKNLARVSSVPGKTTTINFFTVDGIRIADLPGYGYAKRSDAEIRRWGELMEGYFAQNRNIKLVIQLLDMRHDPTQDDLTMLNFLSESGLPYILVFTKCDKLNRSQRNERHTDIQNNPLFSAAVTKIEVSSVTGEGMARIMEAIEKAV